MSRSASVATPALPVIVRPGQIWASRPARKGAQRRFVRIVGVSRGIARIQQPKATWREVTRTGARKTPKKTPHSCTFLTTVEGRWTMPSRWELVQQ